MNASFKRPVAAAALLLAVAGCTSAKGATDSKKADAATKAAAKPVKDLKPAAPVTIGSATVQATAMAVDPTSGRIYAAYQVDAGTKAPSGFGNLGTPYVAWSDDGGKTFSEPVKVGETDGDVGRRITMTVTPKGTPVIAWADNTPMDGQKHGLFKMRLARSTDKGKTWTVTSPLPDGGLEYVSWENITAGPSGDVWLIYLDGRPLDKTLPGENPYNVALSVSHDDGATFSPTWNAKSNACTCCRPAIAESPDGKIAITWRDLLRETKGMVRAEATTTTVAPTTTAPPSSTTTMAKGSMAGMKMPGSSSGDIRDTLVAVSTDHGHDWSAGVAPHKDNWKLDGCPMIGPSVFWDQHGKRLTATWFTGADRRVGVWTASSTDNGAHWSDAVKLTSEVLVPSTNGAIGAAGVDGVRWAAYAIPKSIEVNRLDEDGTIHQVDFAGTMPSMVVTKNGPVVLYVADGKVMVRSVG